MRTFCTTRQPYMSSESCSILPSKTLQRIAFCVKEPYSNNFWMTWVKKLIHQYKARARYRLYQEVQEYQESRILT
jgi:hypothetical protein